MSQSSLPFTFNFQLQIDDESLMDIYLRLRITSTSIKLTSLIYKSKYNKDQIYVLVSGALNLHFVNLNAWKTYV